MIKKLQQGGYYDVNVENGDNYHIYPSALRSNEINVTTPEVIVRGKAPGYRSKLITNSAFNPTDVFEPVHGALELMGKAFNKVTDATGTTNVVQTMMPWLMSSQYVGWARTGNRPGTNTGFGDSKEDQYLSEMFDLGVAPAMMKGAGNAVKMAGKTGKNLIKNRTLQDISNTKIYNDKGWLSELDYASGPEKTFTPSEIKKMYLVTKKVAYKYFRGPEFKERALKAGFKEHEIPLLIKEIEDHLSKTKLTNTNYKKEGALNSGIFTGKDILANPEIIRKFKRYDVSLYPTHSEAQMYGNIWHELMHSIGGKDVYELEYPLLNRLRKHNKDIQPYQSKSFFEQRSPQSTLSLIDDQKWLSDFNDVSSPTRQGKVDWLDRNTRRHDFLLKEIHLKPEEFRSRLSTTLYQLRRLGYDTSELIKNPEKFSEWIKELRNKNVDMPWDLNQLLAIYGEEGLNKAASKILTTTGGVYLGSKMLNNE